MYIIYSLTDPISNKVRYVGKTTIKRKSKRLYEHIRYANTGKTHRCCWIRQVVSRGQKPILNVLEYTNCAEEREKYWIKQFDNLTNHTDGGELNYKFNADMIERFREINTGENNPCYGKIWTQEERKILSDQRKGIPKSDTFKDKISKKLGNPVSIDGIVYQSIRLAVKDLHVGHDTIVKRIKSKDYPNWKYSQ